MSQSRNCSTCSVSQVVGATPSAGPGTGHLQFSAQTRPTPRRSQTLQHLQCWSTTGGSSPTWPRHCSTCSVGQLLRAAAPPGQGTVPPAVLVRYWGQHRHLAKELCHLQCRSITGGSIPTWPRNHATCSVGDVLGARPPPGPGTVPPAVLVRYWGQHHHLAQELCHPLCWSGTGGNCATCSVGQVLGATSQPGPGTVPPAVLVRYWGQDPHLAQEPCHLQCWSGTGGNNPTWPRTVPPAVLVRLIIPT